MLIWLIKPSVLNWIPCTVTNECMLTHQYPLWGPLAPSRVYQCQNLGHPASQPPPDSSGARPPISSNRKHSVMLIMNTFITKAKLKSF